MAPDRGHGQPSQVVPIHVFIAACAGVSQQMKDQGPGGSSPG